MKVKKLVIAAMLAALCCVVTMIVKIPSPVMQGYINPGDCVVLLSGWLLSPWYGFLAAGIGSCVADLLGGYALYVPATFVIKGVMALASGLIYRRLLRRVKRLSLLLSGILAEFIMVLGYFLFEGFLYGFYAVLPNVLANSVQGMCGLILGIVFMQLFKKYKIEL